MMVLTRSSGTAHAFGQKQQGREAEHGRTGAPFWQLQRQFPAPIVESSCPPLVLILVNQREHNSPKAQPYVNEYFPGALGFRIGAQT
jgi:hypothetical protein